MQERLELECTSKHQDSLACVALANSTCPTVSIPSSADGGHSVSVALESALDQVLSDKRCQLLTVLLRRCGIGEEADRAQHDALGDELHHGGYLVALENSHRRKVNEHGLYEEHTRFLPTHPPIAREAERHTREEKRRKDIRMRYDQDEVE